MVERTARKTDPAPITPPILSRELRAVRQEMRLHTLVLAVGVVAFLFLEYGMG